jgi:methylase of polypeptide subunit release factors
MTSLSTDFEISSFCVSDKLVKDVLQNPDEVEEIDGYQGQPITGLGDVYTPEPIVEFILDSVGYTPENEIEKYPIVDLSCGTGSFIRVIVSRLKQRLHSIGYDSHNPENANHIISTVRNNVVALDLNKMATMRTAQLIINELSEEISNSGVENPIDSLRIYNTNSLHPELKGNLGEFRFVVGNPPYVRNDHIDEEDDEFFRENFESAVGKYDLYQLFMEQGIELLEPEGLLGMVTPDRFHHTKYGEPLRKIIQDRTLIQAIVNLEEDPFPVVNAYPSISILRKKEESILNYLYENRFLYCEASLDKFDSISKKLNGVEAASAPCTKLDQDDLQSDQWSFSPPEIQNLISKIGSKLEPLKQSKAAIKTGIATGADDIFILGKADKERIESELLYPIVRGENIDRGEAAGFDHLLNPYSTDGELIDISRYPEAQSYLTHHRSDLEDRYCVREAGKQWYETHDKIYTQDQVERKIVTPDITSSAKFAVVEGCITHNTCYTISHPNDLEAFAGYLSSDAFEFILKSSLPKVESGYWRQLKRDFNKLPVIDLDSITKSKQAELADAYTDKNWKKVNQLINTYLNLSDDDVSLIASQVD